MVGFEVMIMLWRESLDSDGHQLHKYQQNKANNHFSLNTKKTTTYDRHKNVAGLNQLMGSQPFLLDNWIYNT